MAERKEIAICLGDVCIRTEREEAASTPKINEAPAPRETLKELNRAVEEAITNYLMVIYSSSGVKGHGLLEVKFRFGKLGKDQDKPEG